MSQPYDPNQGGYQQGPPPGQQPWQPQQPPQPPPQQYQQQPFGGSPYAPGGQQGYASPQDPSGYNFGALYGKADLSSNLLEKGQYDAIVEDNTWDRTKDGTKSAWTITFRTTTGMHPGTKLTMTLSVSEFKNDGSENNQGLGIMFRQLGALGVPVPPAQPFWELGWTPQQVAQATVGRPVLLSVIQDEYEGITRNKVKDIRPARPGAPTQVPPKQQPQQQPGFQPAQGWQPQQPGQAPQPWQQPQQQPGFQGQGFGQPGHGTGQPGAAQYAGTPGQYQQQYGQQQPPPPDQRPTQYNPNQPPYGQQPDPGQGGVQQFTQQGQAIQPGTNPGHDQLAQQQYQQPWQQPNGGYQQQGQPQQPGQEGPPAPPEWAR